MIPLYTKYFYMTRINANIPPRLLSDNHLRAEQKEILRLPRFFISKCENGTLWDAEMPANFTLGTGHLTFFLKKGQFVKERYENLTKEMIYRKMQPRTSELDIYKTWNSEWPKTMKEKNIPGHFIMIGTHLHPITF
jgi:hypothetical protein